MSIASLPRLLSIVMLGVLAAGCHREKPVLHVYNWADYIKPELVQRFEQAHGCRVVVDTFDSNEAMYAKLKAGAAGYDLIYPSAYMMDIMQQQGMLQPLNQRLLPNVVNLDPEWHAFIKDTAYTHSVPYMISYTGLGWRKSKLPDFTPSWRVFERADLKNRMTMLNDMRETIGAGLKTLGYSMNSTDDAQLAAARDLVIKWKHNLAKFENEQYKSGIASGEFTVVQGYSGDVIQVMGENADVAFAVPVEGASVACDVMAIPKDAKQVALAHAFINFLHDPKVAAENMEFTCYLCPNRAAYPLLPQEMRDNPNIFLTPAVKAKSETIWDLGPNQAKYIKVWDAIKAAE